MESIEMVVVLIPLSYILGLLLSVWMFNRQTKLVEEFKLDNAQLETENLSLKQQVASLTRRNKELNFYYDEIKEQNEENTKRIAILNNEVENFRDDVLRLRNEVIMNEESSAPIKQNI